jgi:hypothetical protein
VRARVRMVSNSEHFMNLHCVLNIQHIPTYKNHPPLHIPRCVEHCPLWDPPFMIWCLTLGVDLCYVL